MTYSYKVEVSGNINIIKTSNCMMFDWDVPDDIHCKESVTFNTKEEIIQNLKEFASRNKNFYFRVYETPGGIHAWCLSHKGSMTNPNVVKLMEGLKVDPLYIKFCRKRKAFACRISPKPGRKNDYIAKYYCSVGAGNILPELLEVVNEHDKLIAANR